ALTRDPALEGAAAYRGGDYAAAADAYAGRDDADGHYNRGNALAKAGRYEDALAAYDAALARAPGMPDAVANRKAVADLLERKKQQQQQQQQQNQQQQQDAKQRQQQAQQQGQQGKDAKDAADAKQSPDADRKDAKQDQSAGD